MFTVYNKNQNDTDRPTTNLLEVMLLRKAIGDIEIHEHYYKTIAKDGFGRF